MAQYKFARPKTTVKQILKESGDQAMFPVVDENNVFQGSILKKDLDNKPDNKTAGEILKGGSVRGGRCETSRLCPWPDSLERRLEYHD